MPKTAERTETPNRTIPADTADGTDPAPPAFDMPPVEATRSGGLRRALIACLAVEAAVVVIALFALIDRGTTPPPEIDPGLGDATHLVTFDGADTFLVAWARSLEQDHRAGGSMTRVALGRDALLTSAWPDPTVDVEDPTVTVLPYRHSRLDGRALTQIGDVATIVDPVTGRRTCIRQTGGFACTSDGDPADEAMAMAAVEQAVEGPTATHRVVDVDPTDVRVDFPQLPVEISCWEARSLTDGLEQRWGRRAQFCFHGPTGAAVFRRILGTTRIEVLTIDTVSSNVSPADLDPA